MRVLVLGSAAGGGFPQWNCACLNCRGLRDGSISATARLQAALAIEAADGSRFLIHASPDLRQQLDSSGFHPPAVRACPFDGVLLTNGDLDQCLGLWSLREGQPVHVYATEAVRRGLIEHNSMYRALAPHLLWHELKLDTSQNVHGDGPSPSLSVTTLSVPGKVPLYLEGVAETQPDTNVALLFREYSQEHANGPTLGYAPCVGGPAPSVDRLLAEADCLFFDGTFWSQDELPALGIGHKTARDMAHWPIGGPQGSLHQLTSSRASRRILIHINNTNPILRDGSAQRREVEEAGVEVAYDGMEIVIT
ncbi:coenzyme PQQ synthesis protein B [Nitrospira sp.]|nr:coenzyme PQQ synthesis protein B [Nitrospira sp.]